MGNEEEKIIWMEASAKGAPWQTRANILEHKLGFKEIGPAEGPKHGCLPKRVVLYKNYVHAIVIIDNVNSIVDLIGPEEAVKKEYTAFNEAVSEEYKHLKSY